MLRKLFRKSQTPAAPSLEREIGDTARRFTNTLKNSHPDARDPVVAVETFIESRRGNDASTPPADLASDMAAYLGEHARSLFGGQWGNDPLFGLCLLAPGGVRHAALGPYQIVRKKWQLGHGLSLATLFENIPTRLESHSHRPTIALPAPADVREDANDFAKSTASRALAVMGRDLGAEIPQTLVGLRTAERWLRGHFLLRAAHVDEFHALGFLLGEVMRGLYGGEWNFDKAHRSGDWADAALTYPELPFMPVGRILKLLIEQPEGNGLDEYARLVPAARNDMRRDRAALPANDS